MSEVKIKNVEIKIDKKTINLSLEQAKELKAALDDLFQPSPVWYYPVYSPQPQWDYTYEIGTDPNAGNICLNISAT